MFWSLRCNGIVTFAMTCVNTRAKTNQSGFRSASIPCHTENMKAEQLYELLTEVEREDPIDYTGLPFDADDLRKLACLNVAEMVQGWDQMGVADRELIMAATLVRLVLENMVLNARICILNE